MSDWIGLGLLMALFLGLGVLCYQKHGLCYSSFDRLGRHTWQCEWPI